MSAANISPLEYSNKEDTFLSAFLKAQSEFKPLKETGKNPHFHSTYSTIDDVFNSCKEALHKNGFMIFQLFEGRSLTTKLCHIHGGEQKSTLQLPEISDPQKLGAAITYYRRYSLTAMLGLSDFDDDGESVSNNSKATTFELLTKDMKDDRVDQIIEANTKKPTGSAGDYFVTFGKFNGKRLKEVKLSFLLDYSSWLNKNAETTGKPVSKAAKEFQEAVDRYFKETHPKHEPDSTQHNIPDLSDIPF